MNTAQMTPKRGTVTYHVEGKINPSASQAIVVVINPIMSFMAILPLPTGPGSK